MFKYLPHYLTIISATLLGMSSPLWDIGVLVWIAFIPFLFLVLYKKLTLKETLVQAFCFQLIFSFIIFFWVPPSFQKLWPDSSFLINTGIFLFLISIVELQILVWALIRRIFYFKNFIITALASAAIYTILDFFAFKFVKDTLAHALYDHYYVKQLVPFIGVYGLTFCIMFINELLFHSFVEKSIKKFCITILILVGLYTPGLVILDINNHEPARQKEVMVIQPNFPYDEPIKHEMGRDKYKIYIAKKMINILKDNISKYPKVKTIILPETIYPIYYYSPDNFQEEELNIEIKTLVVNNQLDLFFGGSKRQNGLNTNVYIHLFMKEGALQEESTTKVKLFPFGEEIPFTTIFPFLRDIFPTPSVALKGEIPGEGNLSSGERYGVAICYETITSEIVQSFKNKPIEFILNPSNEAVFTSFGEPQMALALSSFRAIEIQKPIVRSAATGISALIDKYGRIISSTKMDVFEVNIYQVNLD